MDKKLDTIKILYHASTTRWESQLNAGIDVTLKFLRTDVDFGKGFYATSNFGQALEFSLGKTKDYNQKNERNKLTDSFFPVQPLIMIYEFDYKALQAFAGIDLQNDNEKWKKFVMNNRLGGTDIRHLIPKCLHNIDQGFDFAYGPVADSSMAPLVKSVIKGTRTFDEACDRLIPCNINYDQLSFHNNLAHNKSLNFLKQLKGYDDVINYADTIYSDQEYINYLKHINVIRKEMNKYE